MYQSAGSFIPAMVAGGTLANKECRPGETAAVGVFWSRTVEGVTGADEGVWHTPGSSQDRALGSQWGATSNTDKFSSIVP